MIVHALAGASDEGDAVFDVPGRMDSVQGMRSPPWSVEPKHLRSLAWALRRVTLDDGRAQQASLLLHDFARLRHTHDTRLFGRLFNFACMTLHEWDSHSLALLCNAFAKIGRAGHLRTSASGWHAIAERAADLILSADGQNLAMMAHAFTRVGAPQEAEAVYYGALEEVLTKSPKVNLLLNAQEVALIASGLARHRRPKWVFEVPALFSMGVMPVPYTTWPVEEYVARQVRSFTPQGTAMVLLAIAQLQRGGLELFTPLFRRLHRGGHLSKASVPTLVLLCAASQSALTSVELAEVVRVLRALRSHVTAALERMALKSVLTVLRAFTSCSAAELHLGLQEPRLWRSATETAEFVRAFESRLTDDRDTNEMARGHVSLLLHHLSESQHAHGARVSSTHVLS